MDKSIKFIFKACKAIKKVHRKCFFPALNNLFTVAHHVKHEVILNKFMQNIFAPKNL